MSNELWELGWGFIVNDLMNLCRSPSRLLIIYYEPKTSSNYCISSSLQQLITHCLNSLLFLSNKLPSSHFSANALLDSRFQTSVIFLSVHLWSVCRLSLCRTLLITLFFWKLSFCSPSTTRCPSTSSISVGSSFQSFFLNTVTPQSYVLSSL